jgi:hypothetical protein
MTTQKQAPIELKLVAALFILGGILAVLEVVVLLVHGTVKIDLEVLGIFIGLGLLRFRRGWRRCALVLTWFGLIFLPVFALLVIAGAHPLHVKLLGQQVGYASSGVALLLTAGLFALALWQYRILTRSDVVRLFAEDAEPVASPNGGPTERLGDSEAGGGPPSVS